MRAVGISRSQNVSLREEEDHRDLPGSLGDPVHHQNRGPFDALMLHFTVSQALWNVGAEHSGAGGRGGGARGRFWNRAAPGFLRKPSAWPALHASACVSNGPPTRLQMLAEIAGGEEMAPGPRRTAVTRLGPSRIDAGWKKTPLLRRSPAVNPIYEQHLNHQTGIKTRPRNETGAPRKPLPLRRAKAANADAESGKVRFSSVALVGDTIPGLHKRGD